MALTAARIPTDCPGLGHHRGAVPPLEGGARRPEVHTERRSSSQVLDPGFATRTLMRPRPSAAWTPSGVLRRPWQPHDHPTEARNETRTACRQARLFDEP